MTVKVWRSWPTACGYTSDSQEQLWEGIRYSSWAINLITLVASRRSHYLEFQDLYIFEMDDYMGKFTLRPIIVPWNRPTVSTLTFKLVWWYTFMCSLCEKCYFRVVYKLVWKSFSLAFSNWNGMFADIFQSIHQQFVSDLIDVTEKTGSCTSKIIFLISIFCFPF